MGRKLFVDVMLGLLLGIAANLVTEWITARPGQRPSRSRPWRRAFDKMAWTLPPIALPLAALMVVRYRWVMPPAAAVVFVTAAFLAAVGLLWIGHDVARASRHAVFFWFVWITATIAPGAILDDAMPRYIAMDCPNSPVLTNATFSGRVLGGRPTVELHFGPVSNRLPNVVVVQVMSQDGTWTAGIDLDGEDGEVWAIAAATTDGSRTRLCAVTLTRSGIFAHSARLTHVPIDVR